MSWLVGIKMLFCGVYSSYDVHDVNGSDGAARSDSLIALATKQGLLAKPLLQLNFQKAIMADQLFKTIRRSMKEFERNSSIVEI